MELYDVWNFPENIKNTFIPPLFLILFHTLLISIFPLDSDLKKEIRIELVLHCCIKVAKFKPRGTCSLCFYTSCIRYTAMLTSHILGRPLLRVELSVSLVLAFTQWTWAVDCINGCASVHEPDDGARPCEIPLVSNKLDKIKALPYLAWLVHVGESASLLPTLCEIS